MLLRKKRSLAGLDQGGEVHHGIEAIASKDLIQLGTIGRVAHDQLSAGRHRGAISARQVVIDDYRVSGCKQLRGDNAADVSGPVGHEYSHLDLQNRASACAVAGKPNANTLTPVP